MGKTVIGEMFLIWVAWKIMNTLLKFIFTNIIKVPGLSDVVVGG